MFLYISGVSLISFPTGFNTIEGGYFSPDNYTDSELDILFSSFCGLLGGFILISVFDASSLS